MLATHLGFYNTASTRTHVRFQFSTHNAAGANVAPSTAIDAADIRIYRATDGAAFSATQRSSANGITCTSPFDSLTGFHDVDIDLTDNTDASFYAAGSMYSVVLAPNDETIDSQVITGVVLAYFEIGVQPVNAAQVGGQTASAAGTVTFPGTIASTTNITAGTITTATNVTTVNGLAANVITAAATAADFSTEVNAAIVALLPAALVGGRMDASVGAMAANTMTAAAAAADLGTELGTAVWANATRTLTAGTNVDGSTFTAIPWNAAWDAEVQSEVDDAINAQDLPTNAELATALGTADDAVLAAIAALNNISVANILAGTVEGTTTLVQTLRLLNAALGGKASGLETTTAIYRDVGDTKDRITATVDADGNRTAVILDLT